MAQKHEFYAHPTIFDDWQGCMAAALETARNRLRPWSWSLAFATLAALFVLIALLVLVSILTAYPATMAWNQAMARAITVMMALLAVQALVTQALLCWPAGQIMPRHVRRLVRRCGWRVPAAALPESHKRASIRPGRRERRSRAPGAREVRAFFDAVRAAGVNVAIARALFDAGIRSKAQLLRTPDADLLAIRGVGPVTVARLRDHFSAGADHGARSSSSSGSAARVF